MIQPNEISEFLHYDEGTGVFTWKTRDRIYFTSANQWKNWNGRYPGSVAGTIGKKGYRTIAILDRLYRAHRLAWAYMTEEWPLNQIDHINGDRDDNRLVNLRPVTNEINGRNLSLQARSKSGRIGVTPYNYHGKNLWVARIRIQRELIHLGYFDTIEAASEARSQAEIAFCFHPNHGKSKAKIHSRGFSRTRGEA